MERCPRDHTPNEETRRALRDAEAGRVVRFDTMEDLLRDLETDDDAAPSGGEADR